MMRKLLALSYKGARKYIQGGDFFNALNDTAREFTGQTDAYVDRLTFRRFARLACELTAEQPADLSMVVGQVRFKLPDSSHLSAWLVETDIAVTVRRAFDEDQLLANASLDQEQRSARLPVRSEYSPIEDIIALTKYLNYAVSPEVEGKWVFGQLDLAEPLTENYQALEIQMKNLIAGRFSANDILIDGHHIGSMRFIVGAP
jgi:hypothetical protein